jgi:hypothetical protein
MIYQVTCGGIQSAHTSAFPAAMADFAGDAIRVHLCVRGERPAGDAVGHHRLALEAASSATYISRCDYADRQKMLENRAVEIRASIPTGKVGR